MAFSLLQLVRKAKETRLATIKTQITIFFTCFTSSANYVLALFPSSLFLLIDIVKGILPQWGSSFWVETSSTTTRHVAPGVFVSKG
jgi:hypothetical protein